MASHLPSVNPTEPLQEILEWPVRHSVPLPSSKHQLKEYLLEEHCSSKSKHVDVNLAPICTAIQQVYPCISTESVSEAVWTELPDYKMVKAYHLFSSQASSLHQKLYSYAPVCVLHAACRQHFCEGPGGGCQRRHAAVWCRAHGQHQCGFH